MRSTIETTVAALLVARPARGQEAVQRAPQQALSRSRFSMVLNCKSRNLAGGAAGVNINERPSCHRNKSRSNLRDLSLGGMGVFFDSREQRTSRPRNPD